MKNFIIFLSLSVFIILIKVFCLDIVSISSTSMSPSLWPGEWVIINKLKKPILGDIITFYSENYDQLYIKRLIAQGQMNIAYEDDKVLLNGNKIDQVRTQIKEVLPKDMNARNFKAYEEVINNKKFSILIDENKTVSNVKVDVKENEFFVLGDNRNHSLDSREFGAIPDERIMGVASWVIYRDGSFFVEL